MNAVILSIGDELILGQTVDTNTAWIAARLMEWGVTPSYHLTVADSMPAITRALLTAAGDAPLVIATGGLGPTDDDLTRGALAEAMGQPLALDETSLEQVRDFFRRLNRPMADRNTVQAMLPRTAAPLLNPVGTAPGIRATLKNATVLVFPGVPGELKPMFDLHLLPLLQQNAASARIILTTKVNTYGEGESNVAQRLGDLMRRDRNPVVGTTVSEGVVSVRVRSEFPTRAEAQQKLDGTVNMIGQKLGLLVYSTGDRTLADVVTDLCQEPRRTIAVAESCTGGLLAKSITDVAGCSACFRGGWVVYSNDLKTRQLDVPGTMLEKYGAVSEPVALTLADNALGKSGSDFALSITGVAGPTGGSPDKPVGTVWIAIASRTAPTVARHFIFPGDRHGIRDRAAKTALNMLRLRLLGSAE